MAYKSRRERRANSGKAETEPLNLEHGHQYNAQGSPEEREEHAASDGFKRGGRAKKKNGGKVEGMAARRHLGRRARGGEVKHVDIHMEPHHEHGGHDGAHHDGKHETEHHHKPHRAAGGHVAHKAMARGGSPFSAANKTKPPGNDHDGPGEQAPMIP